MRLGFTSPVPAAAAAAAAPPFLLLGPAPAVPSALRLLGAELIVVRLRLRLGTGCSVAAVLGPAVLLQMSLAAARAAAVVLVREGGAVR
jgi:hypothetical protein